MSEQRTPAYGVHRIGDDSNHHHTTTEVTPTRDELAQRLARLADLHESKDRRVGTTLVDYATGGMDTPVEQITLSADDLRMAAAALAAHPEH